jgi:hypothetical protein
VQGDLHEEFDYQVQRVGLAKARLPLLARRTGLCPAFCAEKKNQSLSLIRFTYYGYAQ